MRASENNKKFSKNVNHEEEEKKMTKVDVEKILLARIAERNITTHEGIAVAYYNRKAHPQYEYDDTRHDVIFYNRRDNYCVVFDGDNTFLDEDYTDAEFAEMELEDLDLDNEEKNFVKKNPDVFVRLPSFVEEDRLKIMTNFAEKIQSDDLLDIVNVKNAEEKFYNKVREQGELENWQKYRNNRVQKVFDSWREKNKISTKFEIPNLDDSDYDFYAFR